MEEKRAGSRLYKKVYGCLLGGAIGDAMGGATEMMHFKTIESIFGEITDLVPHGDSLETARFQPSAPAGTYTDDTRLKHILCEAIIAADGRISADDLGWTWRRSMRGWFFTPVANAYYKIATGDARPRDAGRGNMASNSSAMSIAPIGILNACDPRQAAQDAYNVAGVIHEGYARDAAASVAAAVAAAFKPEASVHSVVEASTAYLDRDAQLTERVAKAIDLARQIEGYREFRQTFYDTMLLEWPQTDIGGGTTAPPGFYDTAEPRETIPAALAIFVLSEGNPERTILYAANFGRDSDTIATIAGSIAGAYAGSDEIPGAWIQKINEANDVDQRALADQLFQVLKRVNEHREAVAQEIRAMLV